MTLNQIANFRLLNQQISQRQFNKPEDLVRWMGALQAQDFPMSRWAIGIRLTNSTELTINKAINEAKIIRTHVLRPTWHIVCADDLRWMLALTAPRIRASMKSRHRDLELNNTVLKKTNKLIEKALNGSNHLTRDDLVAVFQNAKIATDDNRAAHILMNAELDGLIGSGITRNKKHTYALLDERIRKSQTISHEEALARLAGRYFSSHGPATLQDFTWWSGLSAKDARDALEMIKSNLTNETVDQKVFWFPEANNIASPSGVYLLPAYDEFVIGYTDRSATLPRRHEGAVLSRNGIFWPVVVVNGRIEGTWKRTVTRDNVRLDVTMFSSKFKTGKRLLNTEIKRFGSFLGKSPL